MGEIKWVKFEVDMYEDTKLKILDNMDNRDLAQHVWARSLVLAGKINRGGYLYITDNMPHTIKTLSMEFNRSVKEIKLVYKILIKLEMIELTSDKVFKIKNWSKHQNIEGMEKSRQLNNARVAKCRAKKKALNETNNEDNIKDYGSQIDENYMAEIAEDNLNSSNVQEDIKDNKTNHKCNVTCNGDDFDCNVTVMEQNKKESKKKKENKKESESNQEVVELMTYYENITGILGGLNIGFLKLAIDTHGYNNVKMAINKALEVNKANMTYINGILKNWRREGYPKNQVEVKKNESGGIGKNKIQDKNEFAGFKPKEPRKLTEDERRNSEDKLI